MGFVSSFSLIRIISLVHLTAAWFFITAPEVLSEQNVVVILGESMKVPPSSAFSKPTEVTALVGLVLAFLGLTDLVAASLPERTFLEYWQSQLPVRLLGLFSMTGFIYLTRGGGDHDANTPQAAALRAMKGQSGSPLDNLKNSLVFTACFMEVCTWFWIFLCMRDDRRDYLIREAQAQLREEEEKKFRM